MSRILVIEPRRILRQAISLALFPDHQVEVASELSDHHTAGAPECEMVIMDAAALRETGHSNSQLLSTVLGWKVPTIWIDDATGDQAPARDKLVVLNAPIRKETLLGIVTTCLSPLSTKQNGAPRTAVKERKTTKDTTAAAGSQAPQIIELVDVVAEPPGRKQSKSKR